MRTTNYNSYAPNLRFFYNYTNHRTLRFDASDLHQENVEAGLNSNNNAKIDAKIEIPFNICVGFIL